MGLENLEKEILAEANKQAKAILAEAERQKGQILEEAKKKVRKQLEIAEAGARGKWQQEQTEEITKANMEARESIRREKRLLVDMVYQDFTEMLAKRQDSRMLKDLFDIGRKELGSIGAVYVDKRDVASAKKLFRGIEIMERDIGGGIILENRDGTQLVDLGLGTLSEAVRKRTLKKVNEILFGGME